MKFKRVQLGVALSSAEKLRVLNTRRAKFINELRVLYVTEDSLAAPSFRWDRSRGADYRCLAQAVYVISKWGSDNGASLKNAGTLPQVEKWLEDDNESVAADFVALIKKTFSVLVELTTNAEYSVPFQMYTKVCALHMYIPFWLVLMLILSGLSNRDHRCPRNGIRTFRHSSTFFKAYLTCTLCCRHPNAPARSTGA